MENNDEQSKQQQPSKQLSLDQLEQVESDHAFALALQHQENTYTMMETIESDTEEEEEEDDEDGEETASFSSHNFDDNFDTQEFYDELEFLEEEGSYTDEVEEDEIDPDEMSYEELIALGEVVGDESRGLSTDEIASSTSPYVHKFSQCKTTIDRCVICQLEYEEEEHLVALQCQHPFHKDCVNQWLQIKKACPICSIEITPRSKS